MVLTATIPPSCMKWWDCCTKYIVDLQLSYFNINLLLCLSSTCICWIAICFIITSLSPCGIPSRRRQNSCIITNFHHRKYNQHLHHMLKCLLHTIVQIRPMYCLDSPILGQLADYPISHLKHLVTHLLIF